MQYTYRRDYRGPVQAVVLDWAGTTMDYGCYSPSAVFIEVFKRQGVDITIEQAREPMGVHKRTHIKLVSEIEAVRKRWVEVHGNPPGDADIDRMFADFVPLQLECLPQYCDLIPGALETVNAFRERGIKVGSCTGYTTEMMAIVAEEAKKRGYEPDASFCASDVPAARPEPWMALENLKQLRVFPPLAGVKIGDTVADVEEGLNAGMWTIGVTMTGNEIGLNEAEIKALSDAEREAKRARAYKRLATAGAHYVVDALSDCLVIIDQINDRLARGERP